MKKILILVCTAVLIWSVSSLIGWIHGMLMPDLSPVYTAEQLFEKTKGRQVEPIAYTANPEKPEPRFPYEILGILLSIGGMVLTCAMVPSSGTRAAGWKPAPLPPQSHPASYGSAMPEKAGPPRAPVPPETDRNPEAEMQPETAEDTSPLPAPSAGQKAQALEAIRQEIISQVTALNSQVYCLGSLLWEDAERLYGHNTSCASFMLDLVTHQLYLSTSEGYPNQYGYAPTSRWPLTLEEFRETVLKEPKLDRDLLVFRTRKDLELLFDDSLNSAIRAAGETQNAHHRHADGRQAVVLSGEFMEQKPSMELQSAEMNIYRHRHAQEKVIVTAAEGGCYVLQYRWRRTMIGSWQDASGRLTDGEAAWLEHEVRQAVADGQGAWEIDSHAAGGMMSVDIALGGQSIHVPGPAPLWKYHHLMLMLEDAALYGVTWDT